MGMFLDSHCHLDDPQFDEDRERVIERALEGGLRYLLTVGTSLDSAERNISLAEAHEQIHAAVALHPHDAAEARRLDDFLPLLDHPKVVAVGETGLDFYYDNSPREEQESVFRFFLRASRDAGLPLIIHLRDPKGGPPLASDKFLEIVDEELSGRGAGIIHCYTGTLGFALECVRRGFHISFPGVVTFKKADELRQVVAGIPYGRLLVETDCPYLAPVPKRGLRNEPAFVRYTAEEIARVRGLHPEDLDRILLDNYEGLFGLRRRAAGGKIAYRIRDNIYLNITNRCTNRCLFCKRNTSDGVYGHDLRLEREPSAGELVEAVGDPRRFREVVFCGFGEPTLRLETLVETARALKRKGAGIRLDTNGQAELIHGRDILPDLLGIVDAVSVSLNAANAEAYAGLCRPEHGAAAYDAVRRFIRRAVELGFEVTATAVSFPGVNLGAVESAALALGAGFRARRYDGISCDGGQT